MAMFKYLMSLQEARLQYKAVNIASPNQLEWNRNQQECQIDGLSLNLFANYVMYLNIKQYNLN